MGKAKDKTASAAKSGDLAVGGKAALAAIATAEKRRGIITQKAKEIQGRLEILKNEQPENERKLSAMRRAAKKAKSDAEAAGLLGDINQLLNEGNQESADASIGVGIPNYDAEIGKLAARNKEIEEQLPALEMALDKLEDATTDADLLEIEAESYLRRCAVQGALVKIKEFAEGLIDALNGIRKLGNGSFVNLHRRTFRIEDNSGYDMPPHLMRLDAFERNGMGCHYGNDSTEGMAREIVKRVLQSLSIPIETGQFGEFEGMNSEIQAFLNSITLPQESDIDDSDDEEVNSEVEDDSDDEDIDDDSDDES